MGGGQGCLWEKRSVGRKNGVEILPHPSKSKSFPIATSFPFCISSLPSSFSWPCVPSLWLHGPNHGSLAVPAPKLL